MVSYATPSHLPLIAEVCQSFTLDNGAYSAWSSGEELDIEGLAVWIDDWAKHPGFDWYLIPDAIDGDETDNMKMIARWRELVDYKLFAKGVPVWHLHEPIEVLKIMCHAYPRVAFGSSGEYATVGDNKWWVRMTDAMNAICDKDGRPPCKLHGLRMLDPTIFSSFPFSSADSTNVGRNVGLDSRWSGTYVPESHVVRAQVLISRIEAHASASRWSGNDTMYRNMELFG